MILREVRCPDCGKLLFKAAGPFDIELVCSGIKCKSESKIGVSRIKRLTYPLLSSKSRPPLPDGKQAEAQSAASVRGSEREPNA